jgi:hypothetical protein
VPSATLSLSGAFRAIEALKGTFEIEDYSVSQGSLEQVFIRFAKQQSEETGRIAGMTYAAGGAVHAPSEGIATL